MVTMEGKAEDEKVPIPVNHPCWVGTRDQSLPPFEA
jgi:hypothetical protein